jgi:hypothetical protein
MSEVEKSQRRLPADLRRSAALNAAQQLAVPLLTIYKRLPPFPKKVLFVFCRVGAFTVRAGHDWQRRINLPGHRVVPAG